MHGDIDSAGVVPQTSKFNRSFEGGGEAEAVQQQHNISKGVATRLSFSSCHIWAMQDVRRRFLAAL